MIWLGRAVVVIVVAVVVIVVVVVTWQARATVEPARRVAPPGVRARRAELERADALVLAALLAPVGRARGVVAARRIEGDQPVPRERVPGPARARARTRAPFFGTQLWYGVSHGVSHAGGCPPSIWRRTLGRREEEQKREMGGTTRDAGRDARLDGPVRVAGLRYCRNSYLEMTWRVRIGPLNH